jgi:hypothetical protein
MPSGRNYSVLTDAEAEQFVENGYIILRDCFPRSLADEWVDFAFRRLGYDRRDPSTWEVDRVHLPSMNSADTKAVAPKVWAAICDVLGGEERIAANTFHLRDGFIINFRLGSDRPWEPPSPNVRGWHKDGDFFRHFLDSPEQGLLTIVLWTDILPQSGGTFLSPDSIEHVARRLLEHPEGLLPNGFGGLIEKCSQFEELTGKAGDIALIHPFMLHSASQNPSGRPRFITNPPVSLKEPMRFDREDASEYSLVELGVLRALNVERLDFAPTAPRERLVPERVRIQQKMLEEQKARLGIA